ncbi:MAG: N-6 DNA methylase [Candidatus Aenigmatarchaeota archaeon]|nr:N-6 DNA methylase [Candidatus Rehaiarchaeum fermentans]
MKKKIKSFGQYFTPRNVADFMVNLISKDKNVKILEPCAGEGVFLNALINKGYKNITAIELDKSLPNKSPIPIEYSDFLKSDPNKKYDVIIGNPPYVRWKNIPKETQEFLKNDPKWKDKLNGLADLLYAFIYLAVEKLEKGGELIFITPLFWTSTLHSRFIRKYLTSVGYLEVFITFNEMRIFKEVSSNILIFKFIKDRDEKNIKVVHVKSKETLTTEHLRDIFSILKRLDKSNYIEEGIYQGYIHPQFLNGNPWKPLPPHIEPIITKIEETCTKKAPFVRVTDGKTEKIKLSELLEEEDLEELGINKKECKKVRFLNKHYFVYQNFHSKLTDFNKNGVERLTQRYTRLGDVADIGNGMVSGLDRAFQVENEKNFNAEERKHFIKVVKSKNLDRYFIRGYTPYIFINDIEEEVELLKLPNIKKKLNEFKEELLRRYSYNKKIPYWHWVFPRNQELIEKNKIKIIVPCKERIDSRDYVRFALAKGDFYVTQDATVIVKKYFFKEDEKYLLAILNSKIILNWLKYKGLRRGGVLEFSEKPLSLIPIRLIDWDNTEEVKIHDKIVALVDQIIENKNHSEEIINKIEDLLKNLYGLR